MGDGEGASYGVGEFALFWTSTEDDEDRAYAFDVDYAHQAYFSVDAKTRAKSVRCVKND